MIICPKCKGEVHLVDGKTARCSRHGGAFQVLHVAPHIRRSQDVDRPTVHGIGCYHHLGVDALHRCKKCRRGVCKVCDFNFGGGNHLCADCVVEAPGDQLTQKRQSAVRFAYIMAATSTLSAFLVMLLFTQKDVFLAVIGVLMALYLVLIPPIIGFFMALEAMDRYQGNPGKVWGALIWNGALGTLFIGFPLLAVIFH